MTPNNGRMDSAHAATPPAALPLKVAVQEVSGWDDLTVKRRLTLTSDLNTFGRMIGLSTDSVILSPETIRASLLTPSAAALGVSSGRKSNVVCSLRYVARRLGIIDDLPDTPLTADWLKVMEAFKGLKNYELLDFARFCSLQSVEPKQVCNKQVLLYISYLHTKTMTSKPAKKGSALLAAWKVAQRHHQPWLTNCLTRLSKHDYILPIENFPKSFVSALGDIARWLEGPSLDDPFVDANAATEGAASSTTPHRPLRASTIKLRVGHIRWAASALVAAGGLYPPEVLTPRTLVEPASHAKAILRFEFERSGRKPSSKAMQIAEALCIIAKYYSLSDEEQKQIKSWGKVVRISYTGMTEKNQRHKQEMILPAREEKALRLPSDYLKRAKELREKSARRAASVALPAVMISVLHAFLSALATLLDLGLISICTGPIRSARRSRISIFLDQKRNIRRTSWCRFLSRHPPF